MADRLSSMSHSAGMGPAKAFFCRALFAAMTAAGVECGKCPEEMIAESGLGYKTSLPAISAEAKK